jgi:3-oxocholest-4-en-26-oate---CoA ligase
VVGRPSERWGQEVVALVALQPDSGAIGEAELTSLCKSQLAHFKAPKAILFVEQIQRLGNGKPNYRWAKQAATEQLPAAALAGVDTEGHA